MLGKIAGVDEVAVGVRRNEDVAKARAYLPIGGRADGGGERVEKRQRRVDANRIVVRVRAVNDMQQCKLGKKEL